MSSLIQNKKNIGLVLLSILFCNTLFCQQPGRYFISFDGKPGYSLTDASKYLSQRANERRQVQNIPYDINDLPVSKQYIDTLVNIGLQILYTSRWFNGATILVKENTSYNKLAALPFVKSVTFVAPLLLTKSLSISKNKFPVIENANENNLFNYGHTFYQVTLEHGEALHNMGYTGKGLQIAVIDGGFNTANILPALLTARNTGRIIGTKNFDYPGFDIYDGSITHGTSVLSIIGAYQPDTLIGTAPDASFWLLISEEVETEYLVEEYNWAAAAEFADSVGIDVINTSLGYSVFDDSTMNHTYKDMDGKTTPISKAANIAASKGILVVVSAGNDGNKPWRHIFTPADAINVLTVGATDSIGQRAIFSSIGPSYDGRVKPDIMAMGYQVKLATISGYGQGSGTSFSAPVIAGLSACLWQAYPAFTVSQIMNAIKVSASQYHNPDSLYGYGIPDFANAFASLASIRQPIGNTVLAYPNPFNNYLIIIANDTQDKSAEVEVTDVQGKTVLYTNKSFQNNIYLSKELDGLAPGMYFISCKADHLNFSTKIIKQHGR